MKLRFNKTFLALSIGMGLATTAGVYWAMRIGAQEGSRITIELMKAMAREDVIRLADIPGDLSGL